MKKLTIEFIREKFAERGYTLVSDVYVDSKTKLDYVCKNGHNHSISWGDLRSGYGCIYCAKRAKPTYEQVKESFDVKGCTLVSVKYTNADTKLDYICAAGHKHSIRWRDWLKGKYCSKCMGGVRYTFEEVKASFENEGYTLLSTAYINTHAKLRYICSEGHEHHISFMGWMQGQRCAYCKKRTPINLAYIIKAFGEYSYTVLSTEYINSSTLIEYRCDKGHTGAISWTNWYSGHRCPICYYLSKFGKGNPAWAGGVEGGKYCIVWKDAEYKYSIRERDGHRCLNPYCYSKQPNKLVLHHINYDKKDCSPKNLITICSSCNCKANKDRDWHQDWYQALLHNRYGYNY